MEAETMMMSYLAFALISSVTAKELLDRSIAYHDPQGRWERGAFEITDLTSRPDGTGRRTVLRFDNGRGRFEMDGSSDGRALNFVVENDKVDVRLDGRSDLSADEIERYRLTPPQLLTRRNFYLYLWGLPMKLRDPGTRLDPRVKETQLQGKAVYALRVTYDESVGKDTWYFYLDRETCALLGHRFYHDEAAGDGEYTVFSEEVSGQGLRLPRVRKWFRNRDDSLFITHTILSILPH
jgi:hypothetical protein